MNIKIKNSIFVCLLFLLSVIYFPVKVSAQNDVKIATPTIDPLIQEVKDQYQFLSNQATSFSADVKEERKNHQDFVLKIYGYVSALFLFTFGVFQWMGWKSKKEALREVTDNVKREHKVALDKLVNDAMKDTSVRLDTLDRVLRKEVAYNDSCIYLVANEGTKFDNKIIKVLTEKGFSVVECNSNEKKYKNATVVVYYLDQELDTETNNYKEDVNLGIIIKNLEKIKKQIPLPLVVYTREQRIVSTEKLNKYCWYLPANTPVSLINSIFVVANTFYDLKK